MCLPPSRYPGGGPSAIEALCERPLEACRVYFGGALPERQRQQQHGEAGPLARLSGSGAAAAAGQDTDTVCVGGCASLRRTRAPSCPDLRQLAMRERRHSVCVAEVLLHRPAAMPPPGWYATADSGGEEAAAAEGEGEGAGAASGGGSGEPAPLAERSNSDFQALMLKLEEEQQAGAAGAAAGPLGARQRRPWLKPFDPTPVEFCPMPGAARAQGAQ